MGQLQLLEHSEILSVLICSSYAKIKKPKNGHIGITLEKCNCQ